MRVRWLGGAHLTRSHLRGTEVRVCQASMIMDSGLFQDG